MYFAIAVNTTLDPGTLGYSNGLSIYNNWENFVQQEVASLLCNKSGNIQAMTYAPSLISLISSAALYISALGSTKSLDAA